MTENFYDFSALNMEGEKIDMKEFAGKTLLVVNTASKCGLTPQYVGLEALYRKYHDQGLVVLGFPCNQFANQEPGDEKTIAGQCLLNYGVTFPVFTKVDVNGKDAHPIFKYLKRELKEFGGSAIKWNFAKFLVDSTGTPVKRFSPLTAPTDIEKDIIKLLN